MNKFTLSLMVLVSSAVVTSCGGGSDSSGNNDATTVNGTGEVSTGGSLPTGAYSIPPTVNLSCNSSLVLEGDEQDVEIITESGAEGSITADCDEREFVLNSGITNLNITNAVVTDYWYCRNSSNNVVAGFKNTYNLSSGEATTDWHNSVRTTIRCTGDFTSPLPNTITDADSISDLLDYGSDDDFEYDQCTYASADDDNTSENCDEGSWVVGTNATFTDSQGGTHKTSETSTWITTVH